MSGFEQHLRIPGRLWIPGLVLMGMMAGPCAHADQNQTVPATAGAAQASPAGQVPGPVTGEPPASPGQGKAPGQVDLTIQVAQPTDEEIGDSLSARQRYQEAIKAYQKIPDPSAAVWNKMGIAYQMMFNQKDAARCYTMSLKKDPKNAQVLNNMATLYDSQKEYSTAEHYYRKALRIDPKAAVILRNLGSNYMSQRKFSRGSMCFEQAMEIDPTVFQPHSGVSVQNPSSAAERGAMHYYMARSCMTAGMQDCAIQNLRLALNEGFTSAKKIAADSSFASLRPLPAFQQLIAAQTSQ
jgi:tetratricopeptide (TPR) repeat protein